MELSNQECNQLLDEFGLAGVTSVTRWGDGHINLTYRVVADSGIYILQRLNTTIFTDPKALIRNISLVTDFLRERGQETLTLLPAKSGQYYVENEHGFFRLYLFIADTVSYSVVKDAEISRAAGAAFGRFQNELAEFDASDLVETIPFFHHTPKRFAALQAAIAADSAGRVESVRPEIEKFLAREADCRVVTDLLESGEIPQRVTHNDTKINNILFDTHTGAARAIIDLDTVMPGSMLYDFGDAMRTGAASTDEDDPNAENMHLDMELFTAYCQGFVGALRDSITAKEAELLAFSVKLLTLECGIRFLTDYLSGDVYFHTAYPEHNLIRARTQLALVEDVERKLEQMNEIVRAALEER